MACYSLVQSVYVLVDAWLQETFAGWRRGRALR